MLKETQKFCKQKGCTACIAEASDSFWVVLHDVLLLFPKHDEHIVQTTIYYNLTADKHKRNENNQLLAFLPFQSGIMLNEIRYFNCPF